MHRTMRSSSPLARLTFRHRSSSSLQRAAVSSFPSAPPSSRSSFESLSGKGAPRRSRSSLAALSRFSAFFESGRGAFARMNAPPALELSIVIPAYNEESRLPRGLAKIRDYLATRYPAPGRSEIIVVDDGSRDDTAAIAEKWSRELPSLRLVSNGENRGKGYSVRHGMLEARGRVALFTDADLSAPIEEADKLLAA